jgi:DNA excision repair protein ERCC-4
MHEIIHIVVDDRERWSGVPEALAELPGVTVETARLGLGDYVVDDRLVVERKTVTDLADSLCDRRLFRQASRLASHLEHRICLVLEGTMRDAERVHVSREAMQGAMITLTLLFGLAVLRSRGPEETARLVVYAGRQLAESRGGVHKLVAYKPKTKALVQLRMLQMIRGIGPQRARALLDRFGSLPSVLAASEDDLRAVDGFGPQLAERIRWMLCEPTPRYGDGIPSSLSARLCGTGSDSPRSP